MMQRMYATLLALALFITLIVAALVLPLPYVTYSPGLTVDVLGKDGDQEIIQVSGHQAYRDSGQLRMTTVYVTRPGNRISLFTALLAWLNPEDAIYPYDAVYGPDQTPEESETESAVQMVSSQDAATAAALTELGEKVTPVVEVLNVAKGKPADGELKVRDILLKVDDTTITQPQDVVDAVNGAPEGEPIEFVVRRGSRTLTVPVTPTMVDGEPRVGITTGVGYSFPFQVSVNIDDNIGGPSAGLMFSLGIFDTLTPGSLTDGETVAGTGTITPDGQVGPIGGIQQKIVAARDAGAKLFMVPPDNCAAALGAPRGDMVLVRADTMHDAVTAIDDWTSDPNADLPACSKDAA